jgi:hypothetical protein
MKKSGKVNIDIISSSSDRAEQDSRKNARMQALTMTGQSPNVNSKVRDEMIFRDVGQFDDIEIAALMDTQTYGSKKMLAHASRAIQDMLNKVEPELYYGAEMAYGEYIMNFMQENREKLMKKTKDDHYLMEYFTNHLKMIAPIIKVNMQRKAKAIAAGRVPPKTVTGQQTGQNEPGGKPAAGATAMAPVGKV